ncbi:MAG TPA: hypothetical protein VM347_23415 [Nonomuraea sp.]|nr:hypothetical protein [Nonomuraea sp.]
MDRIPIDFTGVRVTALVELYLRWLDSKDPHPILGDPWARAPPCSPPWPRR